MRVRYVLIALTLLCLTATACGPLSGQDTSSGTESGLADPNEGCNAATSHHVTRNVGGNSRDWCVPDSEGVCPSGFVQTGTDRTGVPICAPPMVTPSSTTVT